jgi:hypothetical protein
LLCYSKNCEHENVSKILCSDVKKLLAKYVVTGHCHQNTYNVHVSTFCNFSLADWYRMWDYMQSMMISKFTTQTVKYLIFNFHVLTWVKLSSFMMTCSKHVWYLVLNNPETNDMSMWQYIKSSYITMNSDLFLHLTNWKTSFSWHNFDFGLNLMNVSECRILCSNIYRGLFNLNNILFK